MDKLLVSGALDVTYSSLQMKKNRPGVKVSVLCNTHDIEALTNILLTETSTFGIRKYPVQRSILSREFKKHKTPYGDCTFKYGYLDGKCVKITPEYEELKLIAIEQDMPLLTLYKKIQAYIEKELQ
jgi:uncharacterized protein (DUF111 family)